MHMLCENLAVVKVGGRIPRQVYIHIRMVEKGVWHVSFPPLFHRIGSSFIS